MGAPTWPPSPPRARTRPGEAAARLGITSALLADLLQQICPYLRRHRIRQLALRAEPLVVDLEVLARLERVLEAGVDGRLELGVALAHRHAVGLFGEEVANDLPVVRIRRLRLQAVELDTVVRVGVHLPLDQRL